MTLPGNSGLWVPQGVFGESGTVLVYDVGGSLQERESTVESTYIWLTDWTTVGQQSTKKLKMIDKTNQSRLAQCHAEQA